MQIQFYQVVRLKNNNDVFFSTHATYLLSKLNTVYSY